MTEDQVHSQNLSRYQCEGFSVNEAILRRCEGEKSIILVGQAKKTHLIRGSVHFYSSARGAVVTSAYLSGVWLTLGARPSPQPPM